LGSTGAANTAAVVMCHGNRYDTNFHIANQDLRPKCAIQFVF
jgi:hypothetical protein